MKKTVLTLAAVATLFILSGNSTFAQLKIGYINRQEVLQLMPERDSASKEYEKYSVEINKEFESMRTLYTNLLETYNRQRDSLSNFVRQARETELVEMQGKITNFQEVAQQELQKKQDELMAPIMEKLNKAIKEVAEQNKFTYVLDVLGGTVAYFPEDEALNVQPLVKAKLGIKK